MDFRGWPENRSVLGVSGIRTVIKPMDMIVSREKWTEFVRICQIEWHHDDEQELITVSNV